MKNLNGIFTALLTPFDANNKVNEKVVATRENVYTEDIRSGQLMVPKKELSDVSEINE